MAEPDNEIAKLISRYKAAPLLPLELPLIIKRLSHENASVLDFKNQYFRDPLLCAYIIDLAWYKTQKKTNHPFAADHAMSTVGIDGAKDYLSKMSTDIGQTALDATSRLPDELKFIMTSSLLAAELAKNLCSNKQKSNSLYWASMAHQFPDLLLWYLKPRPMWRIQYRQIKLAKKLPIFEQAKLGFELNQWRSAVAQEWHMSEVNQQTYDKKLPDKRKQLLEYMRVGYNENTPNLKEWHNTDNWQILTTNWLARSIISPWMTNSYQHYFHIAKQSFATNDKHLSNVIMDSTRITSEHLKDSLLFVPAVAFLNLKSQNHYPDWLNTAPMRPVKRDKKYVQKASQLKQSSNQLVIQKLIRELRETPEKFANSNKLFREVLRLCIKRLGFSRACLLVVDWQNKQVSTSLFLQQDDKPKIKPDFDFKVNTPLKKFLVEQGFLVFDINKHAKIWRKLPSEIIQQQVNNFILFSLKPDKQVKALIYLDMQGKKPPSVEKIKIVKLLLNSVNGALTGKQKK